MFSIPHPPGAGFPSSIARQPRGYQHRNIRLQMAIGGVLPMLTFFALTLFQLLSRYRALKIGPGESDIYIHRRARYFVPKPLMDALLIELRNWVLKRKTDRQAEDGYRIGHYCLVGSWLRLLLIAKLQHERPTHHAASKIEH